MIITSVRIRIELIIISILTVLILGLLFEHFIFKNIRKANEFQRLASIPPELIISYQQIYPDTWKDYVSILAAKDVLDSKKETMIIKLHTQLDNGLSFNQLNWTSFDKEYIITAGNYRKLLEKYPVYNPDKYTYPLNIPSYMTDTFGADREGGQRKHQGTDIFNSKGTLIISVCDGVVEKLGWNRLGGERVGVRGFDGNYYYYAHLDQINEDLQTGQKISKGEPVGIMGNTGDAIATPDHLHFGIELPNGKWLNPYSFLKVWEYQKFGLQLPSRIHSLKTFNNLLRPIINIM